jgi:thioredoxin-related protein
MQRTAGRRNVVECWRRGTADEKGAFMKARNLAVILTMMVGLMAAAAEAASDKPNESNLLPPAELGEDGLYHQPWFLNSFLDLREDLKDAAAKGKRLAILWDQRGCPYCRETHLVNLRVPEVVEYINANFDVIQMNLRGAREVVDFDGKTMTEREFARRYAINFTPTIQFFPDTLDKVRGKSGQGAEVWRLLGYWKPFHFLNSFVYVRERAYETDLDFQEWLSERAKKLRSQGKEIKLW